MRARDLSETVTGNSKDPFAAIEPIMPWEVFTESITEAERIRGIPEGVRSVGWMLCQIVSRMD